MIFLKKCPILNLTVALELLANLGGDKRLV